MLLPAPGASIDLEKTSHDYEDANIAYFWNRFSFWNYARPPTVILEVGLETGSQNQTRGGMLGKGPNSSREVGPGRTEGVALGGALTGRGWARLEAGHGGAGDWGTEQDLAGKTPALGVED